MVTPSCTSSCKSPQASATAHRGRAVVLADATLPPPAHPHNFLPHCAYQQKQILDALNAVEERRASGLCQR